MVITNETIPALFITWIRCKAISYWHARKTLLYYFIRFVNMKKHSSIFKWSPTSVVCYLIATLTIKCTNDLMSIKGHLLLMRSEGTWCIHRVDYSYNLLTFIHWRLVVNLKLLWTRCALQGHIPYQNLYPISRII